jgi:hypothetical protein
MGCDGKRGPQEDNGNVHRLPGATSPKGRGEAEMVPRSPILNMWGVHNCGLIEKRVEANAEEW